MEKYIFILLVFIYGEISTASIVLHEDDAVVWHPEQVITGEVSGVTSAEIIVHHESSSFKVPLKEDHSFTFNVTLKNKENKIWVEVPHDNSSVLSDTLNYKLRYNPTPVVKPTVTVDGDQAFLKANVVESHYNKPLEFLWSSDPINKASSIINSKEDSIASVKIPENDGNYFYDLLVTSGDDSVRFETMVTREDGQVNSFDIDSDVPHWMDEAILYEITPYSFVEDGTLKDITAKLPELKELGINTIWLQPVTKSYYDGQRYDVTDYFSIDPELGTKKELEKLVTTAKELGLRVLFDVVLNHTSIQHPYAKDVIKNGEESPYYNYYQREQTGRPYSSFYNVNEEGFITYFWEDLVNVNYNNPEVQRWMLEAVKYWVREYDIDGYRFDAIWGVNSRNPSFARKMRTELKSIKPDLLLLAEDKGTNPEIFELGYDAAYDWAADTSWVSQWSWEYEYSHEKNHTIFNFPGAKERGGMLREALFNDKDYDHRLLRYMANNDLPHFIQDHSTAQTKMAAGLLFSLPGIPMIYNGQEIGIHGHPYEISSIFDRDRTIQYLSQKGLYSFYKKVIRLHKQYPALISGTEMDKISIAPDDAMVAFHRWKGNEDIVVVVNMGDSGAGAMIDISQIIDKTSPGNQLRDILSGDEFPLEQDYSQVEIQMEKHSIRWLHLEK